MDIEKQVEQVLFEAIEEINDQLPEEQHIAKKMSTPLFGEDSGVDSLTLVNLIVAAEQKIQEQMDAAVTLADEKAMSQKNSPFRSVESLAAYIVMLLNEH